MPSRVVASINSPAGDHCVDVFQREDGSFGFEEYRRDVEGMRGWFPLNRFSSLVFDTEQQALAHARAAVEWMVPDSR